MKKTMFRIHGWLGLCLGLLLAVMGATGAMLAFEDEITAALAPGYFEPGLPKAADLAPDALAGRLQASHPGYRLDRLEWESDRRRSHGVRLAGIDGGAPLRGRVDRATGLFLAEPSAARFFATVETVHRWLALPGKGDGPGRLLTMLGALALLGFAATGLALRWPRSLRQCRKLFVPDLRARKGRLRVIHRVLGIWVLPLFVMSALTGLWWSSETYQAGLRYLLTGEAAKAEKRGKGWVPAWHADAAWRAFEEKAGARYAWARITMAKGTGVVRIEAREAGATHAKAADSFEFAAENGRPISQKSYADETLGQKIAGAMLEVHRGSFFGMTVRLLVLLSSLSLPFFAASGLSFWWQRRASLKRLADTQRGARRLHAA